MLINNIDDFVKQIPTAMGTEFDSIQPYLESAENSIIDELLGLSLFEHIKALTNDVLLKKRLIKLIAYKAYFEAIPFVDLIQTNNGFAVVSNSNQAPASKERVGRLMERSRVIMQNNIDGIILSTQANSAAFAKWKEWSGFDEYTKSIFLTGIDLSKFITATTLAKRDELDKHRSEIIALQTTLCVPIVSQSLFDKIINQIRENSLTEPNKKVLYYCKTIIGLKLKGDEKQLKNYIDFVSTFLDDNIGNYSEYKNSKEYQLKHAEKYQNKQSDTTFFSC